MNKDVKLFVRITDTLDQRIQRVMGVLPGDKSDFVRFALERVVSEYEDNLHLAAAQEPRGVLLPREQQWVEPR